MCHKILINSSVNDYLLQARTPMAKINLKQISSGIKSSVAQATGKLESIRGAAGTGGFSVSAGRDGISVNANFNELLKKTTTGNMVNSPLQKLYDASKIKEPLQFPDDLTDEHYMVYTVKGRERQSRQESPTPRTLRNIVLPVPSNLQTTYGAQYENTDLGALGAAAAGRVSADDMSAAGQDLVAMIQSKVGAATSAFKSGDTDAAVQTGAQAAPAIAAGAAAVTSGAVVGSLAGLASGGGVMAGVGVDEGLAINPHMAVLFKGVDMREHSFSYKFIARNEQESINIQKIIDAFKWHMHPEYAFGTFGFQYPDEFEIEFASSIRDNLYRIGTCVLKSMTVNYNGEGIPLFFQDTGAPVSVELQLSFQETKIITRSSLDSGAPKSNNSTQNGAV